MKEKRCSKCGETKPIEEFHRAKVIKDGRRGHCKECRKEYEAQRVTRPQQTRRKRNPEKLRAWIKENPEKVRAQQKRAAIKRRSAPRGKLNHNISHAIWKSLQGNKRGRRWEALVGYTVEQLKAHLEKQFEPGMTWQNHGREWHIDHKIPKAAFNFETAEDIDFKRCWALRNLKPMRATDNIKKKDKINHPFQPSLAIAI